MLTPATDQIIQRLDDLALLGWYGLVLLGLILFVLVLDIFKRR